MARQIDHAVPLPAGTIQRFFFGAAVFLQGARVLQTSNCSRHNAPHGIVCTSHGFSMTHKIRRKTISCHILTTTQREKCKTAATYSNNETLLDTFDNTFQHLLVPLASATRKPDSSPERF